ncbi:MAG: copper resistance CopC family protein [Actinomycetota bacterium]
MRRVGLSAVFAVAILCLGTGAAWAHGDTVKTDPKKNARVAIPKMVSVTLSEEPVPQSQLVITDGCGDDVTGDVSVEGETLQASIGDAQPGKWKAAYRVVSAVDGHPTEDDWSFMVQGTADCDGETDEVESTDEPSPEPTTTDDGPSSAAGDDSGTTNTSDSEESSFPVVPLVLGGVAIVAVAAVVRAKSAG